MNRRSFLRMATAGAALTPLAEKSSGAIAPAITELPQLPAQSKPVTLQAIRFEYSDPPASFADGSEFIRLNEREAFTGFDWEAGREFSKPVVYKTTSYSPVKVGLSLSNPADQNRYHLRAGYEHDPQTIALGEADGNPSVSAQGNAPIIWNLYSWENYPENFRRIGVHDVRLLWQYAPQPVYEASPEWQDLVVTRHRVFVIIEFANGPWSCERDAVNNPWLGVLELACAWADGATTKEEAAARITRQIYRMGRVDNTFHPGKKIFAYGQGPLFTSEMKFAETGEMESAFFDLPKFLEHLKDPNSPTMGGVCNDWATIVVTFANILGCGLSLARFEPVEGEEFILNSALLIGSNDDDWRSRATVGAKLSGFDNHVVAAQKSQTPDEYLIYDACLAVDEHARSQAPHTALVATKMKFGPATDPQSYLYHLIDAEQRERLHFFVHKDNKTYPRFYPITKL